MGNISQFDFSFTLNYQDDHEQNIAHTKQSH